MKTLFKTTSAIIALAGSIALVSTSAGAANIGGLSSAGVAAGDGFVVKAADASKPRKPNQRDFTYSRSMSDAARIQKQIDQSRAKSQVRGQPTQGAKAASRS